MQDHDAKMLGKIPNFEQERIFVCANQLTTLRSPAEWRTAATLVVVTESCSLMTDGTALGNLPIAQSLFHQGIWPLVANGDVLCPRLHV